MQADISCITFAKCSSLHYASEEGRAYHIQMQRQRSSPAFPEVGFSDEQQQVEYRPD